MLLIWPAMPNTESSERVRRISIGILAVGAFATTMGCSQGSTGSEYPPSSQSQVAASSGPRGLHSASPAGSASSAPVSDFSACSEMSVESLAEPPDGGVVMNNATTAGDAGGSDRFQPLMDLVTQHRPRFACCFDLWGRNNPGKAAKIALFIDIDPTGTFKNAGFKKDETEIDDPRVEQCMSDVAGKLTFAPSPGGHNTKYVHRFKFRTRK